jgi:hypothetical protein
MSKWEKDYAEIQGQMIVEENVTFTALINSIRQIADRINS